ncbi:Trk potassium uptake system protein TrkA [Candidatus Syntrophocurvum alkaliphilum]|uniref:Trk system potassium uptake protein TrkA n=1 Tax=Candidatus Syntrophocurvum alkaliphilum TaxID=2293317 RepID=A0A6I6DDH2_9FIRM|nr:Trk system potassium transporter TrkA [Candidatus Syntrophocurvum alkaliphilum]QGT99326.1 Trk potassium uptake system protein TrkA [Candidatus Syntrophocurvum alkaliphilum]
MKSIIIGAGKVGFSIAQLLSSEDHDVVIIEHDEDRIEILDELLDVKVIKGSGSSWSTLEAAGVKKASMVVAVTEIDEVNMISCLLAKQYGVETTIARVRNPEYTETPHFSPEALLGIDLIINPERVTAMEIAKIIRVPEALNVDYYADNKVQLVELVVDENSPIAGTKLKFLETTHYVIVSIIRKHRMLVPTGEDIIYAGDHIYVMAKTKEMPQVIKALGIKRKKIENITILGGGRTGWYLAHILEKQKVPVNTKIIEKNYKKAQNIAGRLEKTLVIYGDGSDLQLLESENIGKSDLLIAVTSDDKINLLSSLIGKNLGVKKTISQIKRTDVMPLVEQVGIDIILSPRILTAGAILKYTRQGDIISVTVLGEDRAEMIELIAQPKSIAVNKPLKKLRFPNGSVVGAIVRGDSVIVPTGDSIIEPYDQLMMFTLPKSVHKVEKLFINGGKKF